MYGIKHKAARQRGPPIFANQGKTFTLSIPADFVWEETHTASYIFMIWFWILEIVTISLYVFIRGEIFLGLFYIFLHLTSTGTCALLLRDKQHKKVVKMNFFIHCHAKMSVILQLYCDINILFWGNHRRNLYFPYIVCVSAI